MSSVMKRGAVWYVKFRDADGKARRVATKALTRTEARNMATELERNAERIRLGLEAAPAPLPQTQGETMGELVEWWFSNYAHTQSKSDSMLSQLRKWVVRRPIGQRRINEIITTECEAWLKSLEPTAERAGLANGTINKLRSWCHSSWSEAIKTGRFVGSNPWDKTERRQKTHKKGSWVTPAEMFRILAALPVHYRPLFAVTVYTGLRRGEVLGLTKPQVDLERRQLIVDRTATRATTKGEKDGNVPIVDSAVQWFEIALNMSPKSSERVFVTRSGRPYSPNFSVARWMQSAARAAGITRYLRFHDLRHTTGVLLTMDGVPIQVVSKILRHADIKTTMLHYQHFQPEHLRHEASKLTLALPPKELAPELVALMPSVAEQEAPYLRAVANDKSGSKLGPRESQTRKGGSKTQKTSSTYKTRAAKRDRNAHADD